MSTSTVANIIASQPPEGTTYERIGGIIQQVWPVHSWSSQNRSGTVQTILFSDPGGNDRLRMKLWDHPVVDQTMRGQYIEAIAAAGKNGPRGIRLVYEEYNGRRDQVITVNREASVTIAAYTPAPSGEQINQPPPAPAQAPVPAARYQPQQQPPAPAPAAQPQPQPPQPPSSWRQFNSQIDLLAARHAVAFLTAHRLGQYLQHRTGKPVPIEVLGGWATAWVIESLRNRWPAPVKPWEELEQLLNVTSRFEQPLPGETWPTDDSQEVPF